MAEQTVFRNNALPYPIYGQQYTIVYPLLDADGDPVTAGSPDSEVSKNGDTFADCTNADGEIATGSGIYYITLTATEMTADIVAVQIKSASAKTTLFTLYPRKLVVIRSGTANDDGTGTADIVLDAGASAVDDFYNGMVVAVIIDAAASAECRVITDYTGSTKTATVAVGFNTAVDNTDTFIIYLPEGVQLNQANVTHFGGAAGTFATGRPEVNTTHIAGSAVSTASAQIGVNVVNAGGTAWASGSLTSGVFASGAITAAAIATDAIGAAELAADAATEIGTAVWATAARSLTVLDEDTTTLDLDATIRTAVGLASANLDTQLAALPTAATTADAVWDETASGHVTVGSFGAEVRVSPRIIR